MLYHLYDFVIFILKFNQPFISTYFYDFSTA